MSSDIKTPEQIKISLAAIRLHGHILAWVSGFILGFVLWFWFRLSPRPETQVALLEYGAASFMNWLGALSWFPRLQWFYQRNAGAEIFPYFIAPLMSGFIAAACALLTRLFILSRLSHKPDATPPDKIMRGVSQASDSAQSALDRLG